MSSTKMVNNDDMVFSDMDGDLKKNKIGSYYMIKLTSKSGLLNESDSFSKPYIFVKKQRLCREGNGANLLPNDICPLKFLHSILNKYGQMHQDRAFPFY